MSVTLKEIAACTGLSKPTVARILGKDGHKFSPETRRRVIEVAAEMGYRPNAAARAIGRGRFGCVALILGNDAGRSDLPEGLLRGVHDELVTHNAHLTVSRLPDEQLTSEGFVPKVLRESMADGMLINYTHDIPERMLGLIRSHSAPAVWINTRLDADCVHPDDFGGGRLLTEHLLALGHRRIAYTKFDWSTHYSGADRRAGYEAAMQDAGLPACVIDGAIGGAEQLGVALGLLRADDRPTAVIARPEDASTFAYAAATLGLQVPHDLSVASIAGRGFDLLGVQCTTACVPSTDEGKAAVQMLMRKLESPHVQLPPVVVPFELYAGRTAARAPA